MCKRTKRWFQRLAAFAASITIGAAAAGAAWAGAYVDNGLPDLKAEDLAKVAQPAATQLLFEFQTRGVTNQRATTEVKKWVVETVQASGLFTSVSEGPLPEGGLLTVTINNVPQDGAAGKGVVTGLTFGLKGTTVADYYDCTFEFTPAPGAAKVSKTLRHTIYTTIGASAEPENATKVKNIGVAVEMMVRQAVSHGVNDLGKDPAFVLAAPAAAPTAPSETAPTPVAGQ